MAFQALESLVALHGMTALPHSLRSAVTSVALSPVYPKKRSFEDLGLPRSWSRAHPPPRFACAGSRASAGSARIGCPGRTLRPSLRPRLDRRRPVAFSPAARWSLSTGTVAELMAEFAVEKMDRRARRFTFRCFGQMLSGPRAGLLDTRISPLHPGVQRSKPFQGPTSVILRW